MGKGGWKWVSESVYCAAGLVYHKPPSCQYYDRSEMDTVSFAQGILGRGITSDRREGGKRDSSLVLRTSVRREVAVRETVVRESEDRDIVEEVMVEGEQLTGYRVWEDIMWEGAYGTTSLEEGVEDQYRLREVSVSECGMRDSQ